MAIECHPFQVPFPRLPLASAPLRRYLIVAALTVAAVLALFVLKEGILPSQLLMERHQDLQDLIARDPLLSAVAFILFYALVIALAIPGGTILSLSAGYLFGPLTGIVLALCGATAGAMLTLFLVRSVAGDLFRRRIGDRLGRIREVFVSDPARHLLLLRLIPLFPFFAVNIAIALLGVRPVLFLWTTALGILPATAAYAFIGSGLGEQLEQGHLPGPELLLEPLILWPALILVALLLLAGRLRRDL
jgi:uncharacterized membrane protein YdjX (TVP38/TMEM64 family)